MIAAQPATVRGLLDSPPEGLAEVAAAFGRSGTGR
jgi:hypothetical protein